MSTGVGARALGMGGAHVALFGDATSAYWNPAGLVMIHYPEIAAMHSRRFGGVINYDYLGFAVPFRARESLAISVLRLAVDDIPITALPRPNLDLGLTYTDEQGNILANRPYVVKTVNDAEYAFLMSYSRRHTQRFAYGVNAKFVHKGVGDHSAWGLGFDLAGLYRLYSDLTLGINFQDVTTTLLAWNTGRREHIAPTAKMGFSYPLALPFLNTTLLLAADTDVRLEGRKSAAQANLGGVSFDFRFGGELAIARFIALRYGRDDLGYLTAGAGLRLPRLDLDYAFLSHDEFNATHRVSLRLRLEEAKFLRKK